MAWEETEMIEGAILTGGEQPTINQEVKARAIEIDHVRPELQDQRPEGD
jgi:hypothetical protein